MAKNTINPQNLFNSSGKVTNSRGIGNIYRGNSPEAKAAREKAIQDQINAANNPKPRTRTINPEKVFGRSGQSGDTSPETGKGNPILNSLTSVREKVLNISSFLADQAKSKAKEAKKKVRNFQLKREEDKKKQEEEGLEKPDKPLQNALLAPVQEVGKRAQGILQRLVDAFTLIFAGWLTDKTFKLIQAFASGDGKTIRKIGLNLIGPLAAFSGIVATMFFGLGAVPLLIAKVVGVLVTVGGAILGFLLSPPGLITLAIAAGIGAAFLGIKKLNQFLRGGKDAEEARDRNKQMLRDAGIKAYKKDGARVMRDGKEVFVKTEDLTDEERAAREAFEVEQQRIKDVTKDKKGKLKEVENKIKADRKEEEDRLRKEGRRTKDYSALHAHEAETKRLIQEEKKRIRGEATEAYADPNAKIEGISNVSNTKIDKSLNNPNINQEVGGDNIEVSVNNIPNQTGQESLKDGASSNVPNIKSGDDDNMYTAFGQSQYGTFG